KEFQSWMLSNKDAKVVKVYGYTERHSSAEMNLELAQRRANTVYSLLAKSNTIMLEEAEIKGFGENTPQNGSDSRQRNVVIWYERPAIDHTHDVIIPVEGTTTKFTLGRQRVKAQAGDNIRLKSLEFFPGSDKVLPECYPILDDLLKALADNPGLKIEIQGHICCHTSDKDLLSKAREIGRA